jgi:AcrR family transcriptional regulator
MTGARPAAADSVGGAGAVPAESKARILRSALVLFARNGYDGTSLKAIATQVGVSTPALYWHFKSKDEIYLTAIEKSLADFVQTVRGAVHSSDPMPRFREFVSAHIRFQLERREEAGLYAQTIGMRHLAASLPGEHRAAIVSLQRSYLNELREILLAGRDDAKFAFADVRTTAFAVTTLCEYVHTWFNPDGPLSIDEVVQLYADLALRMVGAEPAPPEAGAEPGLHGAHPGKEQRRQES